MDILLQNNAAHIIERYKHIPQGGNWKDIPQDLMKNYADRTRCHTGIYRRLNEDQPSVVLGNYRKNMLVHPWEDRGLSVREAAPFTNLFLINMSSLALLDFSSSKLPMQFRLYWQKPSSIPLWKILKREHFMCGTNNLQTLAKRLLKSQLGNPRGEERYAMYIEAKRVLVEQILEQIRAVLPQLFGS